MISLEKAQELLLEKVQLQSFEEINILEAKGRVLGENIYAPIDSPPFNRSPLDGYAVCSRDLKSASKENPIKFEIIDKIYAGYISKESIKPFEAIRIMTGAKIPEGADTIVRQEDTELLNDNEVNIFVEQNSHDNFIFKGEDFKKGSIILNKGIILNASELTAIASLGLNKVKVYKKPVVAIITIGDELQSPGTELAEGKIYNSNRIFLKMRLEELGCEVEFFDSVNDEEEAIYNLVKDAEINCDILISTGGVSVGEKDIVKEVVQSAGYELLFWKVDIKPGSPMFGARNKNDKLYIGLSGTPVAAATTFELTVRRVISKLMGCPELDIKKVKAKSMDSFTKISKKRRFLRVKVEQEKINEVYINYAYQSPGQINTMINSNAILEVPKNTKIKPNMDIEVII